MCIYIYICGKFYIPIPEFIMQNLIRKFNIFIRKPFFSDYRTVFGLWMLLAVIAWVMKYFHHSYNNFMIFRQTFWHALSRLSLYAEYPAEYFDHNHYGPFFTLFVCSVRIYTCMVRFTQLVIVFVIFVICCDSYFTA